MCRTHASKRVFEGTVGGKRAHGLTFAVLKCEREGSLPLGHARPTFAAGLFTTARVEISVDGAAEANLNATSWIRARRSMVGVLVRSIMGASKDT